MATFRKNLSRNFKLGSKRKKISGSKQVRLSCWQQYKIFHSGTKYFTTKRNILQQYEIFCSSTKYFTAVRNILQLYAIFYSGTQNCTAVWNILHKCEIFYRIVKYITRVRNILQQYEIFYSCTKYFTAVRNILHQYEIFYRSTKYFTIAPNILQQYEIFYSSKKYFIALRNILQEYEIFYSNTKYFTAVWNILQQYEIYYGSITVNGNQMLHFLGVTGNFFTVDSYIYLNNNIKKWYCCFHCNNGEAKALNITWQVGLLPCSLCFKNPQGILMESQTLNTTLWYPLVQYIVWTVSRIYSSLWNTSRKPK